MLKYSCLHAYLGRAARSISPRLASRGCAQTSLKATIGAARSAVVVKGTPHPLRPWHPMIHDQLRHHVCSASSSSLGAQSYSEHPATSLLWQRILKVLIKLTAGLMLFSITSLALLPAIISSSTGLHAVLAVTNRFVPGHIAIEKVCCVHYHISNMVEKSSGPLPGILVGSPSTPNPVFHSRQRLAGDNQLGSMM